MGLHRLVARGFEVEKLGLVGGMGVTHSAVAERGERMIQTPQVVAILSTSTIMISIIILS